MHRRRILGLGAAAAVGLTGYAWTRPDRNIGASDTNPKEAENETPNERVDSRTVTNSTTVGGTLNGHPRILKDDLTLIQDSNTSWLHAFLDVRGKFESGAIPVNDRDVEVLRRVATEADTNIAVSLLWDFKGTFGKTKMNVPEPGSRQERALFEYATKLLAAIDHPPEVLVLGNEPMWETPKEDVHGPNPAVVPFTRNLKDHLVEHYRTGESKLLVGSFNRLHSGYLNRYFSHFRRGFFEMARNDGDIDGVDLHVHFEKFEEAEEMIATAREEVPNGIVTTTEFSPAGRYNKHENTKIAQFESGKRFVNRYDFPEDMTVKQYFKRAINNPRPRKEIAAFYEAMPWYNVRFVEDMYNLLKEYEVSVGFILFMVGPGLGNGNWPTSWTPYPLNGLYQVPLINTKYGAHPHYLSDYRARAVDAGKRDQPDKTATR